MVASLKIVVLEDHDALRVVTMEVLAAQGHEVQGLPSAEALDELNRLPLWDVAVLDLNLPGEDGLSVARRLRQTLPEIRVVMVTARQGLEDRLAGYQHGADIYLTKPTDPRELLVAVEAVATRLPGRNMDRGDGTWALHVAGGQLTTPKGVVALRLPEVRVLQALTLAPDQSLEHWQLLQLLHKKIDDQGKAQLEVLVSRLRHRLHGLGAEAPAIRAERGRGYRLCLRLRLEN